MKTRIILVVAGAAILIGVGVAAYLFNKPHINYQKADAKFTGMADDFYAQASANQTEFMNTYVNQAVMLKGEILRVESETSVMLAPGILCHLVASENNANLTEGTIVKLQGRVVGAEEDLLTGELLIAMDQCEQK